MAYASEIEKLEKRWLENPRGRNFAPLADAYRKAGEIDRAIELCVSGLERHPDYVSAHIVYGRCLMDQKNDVGAEEVFKKVLSLDPENIIALKVLAEIAERGSRHDEAVDWLSRLLAADPMNGDAEEHLKQARSKAAAAKAAAAAAPPEPVVEPVVEAIPEPRQSAVKPAAELIDLDAIAATDAPTAAMSQPSFPQDAPLVQHDEVILQSGTRSAEIETFDGDLGFTTAAPGTEGLVVEESEPLQPDGLNVEGLARTQYEGSGMFRLDAPEGPPPAEDTVGDSRDSGPAADLPLIMPDDIEPGRRRTPEPVRRPSRTSGTTPVPAAVSLSDDEGAADAATLQAAEPVVTETMGDLYLQQGHREDASRVYRALLAERPGDARLAAKLRDLEAPVSPAPRRAQPPAESATAFLRRVWRGEPSAPLAASLELTGALEAAFALAPRQSESLPQASAEHGQPTQPAGDVISLDAVFGDQVGRGSAPDLPPAPQTPAADEAPAAGRGGFSFDDFFGAGGSPARPSPRTSRPNRPQPEDEDLDQFQAWLKGLKT